MPATNKRKTKSAAVKTKPRTKVQEEHKQQKKERVPSPTSSPLPSHLEKLLAGSVATKAKAKATASTAAAADDDDDDSDVPSSTPPRIQQQRIAAASEDSDGDELFGNSGPTQPQQEKVEPPKRIDTKMLASVVVSASAFVSSAAEDVDVDATQMQMEEDDRGGDTRAENESSWDASRYCLEMQKCLKNGDYSGFEKLFNGGGHECIKASPHKAILLDGLSKYMQQFKEQEQKLDVELEEDGARVGSASGSGADMDEDDENDVRNVVSKAVAKALGLSSIPQLVSSEEDIRKRPNNNCVNRNGQVCRIDFKDRNPTVPAKKRDKGLTGIKRVKWSEDEVEALIEGLRKHAGKGNAQLWKTILLDKEFAETLALRDNTNLKDKYLQLRKSKAYDFSELDRVQGSENTDTCTGTEVQFSMRSD